MRKDEEKAYVDTIMALQSEFMYLGCPKIADENLAAIRRTLIDNSSLAKDLMALLRDNNHELFDISKEEWLALVEYKTPDGLLTIEWFGYLEGVIRISAADQRICFCSKKDLVTLVDDPVSELQYMEFENSASITLDLKDSSEVKDIAAFLGVDIYQYADNGNDYVKKSV